MPLPRRLLIANRGEIACRIAATAHRLGIDTVGIHHPSEVGALHAAAVDRSVRVDAAAPRGAYLDGARLVDIALDTGCDAVHPGYGFLAEDPGFAGAVAAAGLTWVGPPAEQIALLGDKIEAKRLAAAAGVPATTAEAVDPGHLPPGLTFPVIVKAAAGGGGRGMRIVRHPDELADAVAAAARDAEMAFGDPRVFVEPYLEGGRHVEVQILGDHHGNLVHLGDRECGIQRRHQKLIEEAPAPGVPQIRERLHAAAVALGRHVEYRNAGTVEFLVGADGRVELLEVNTRLQVEHPVTEAITGLDLVEWQLRVAAGEPLAFGQSDVSFFGHAVEARLVAEDPAARWRPTTGRVVRLDVDPAVRFDTGYGPGSEVTADFDTLLGKVIATGSDREGALRRLARALRTARIAGVETNRDALVAILEHPDFVTGRIDTGFVEAHPDVETAGPAPQARDVLLAAATAFIATSDRAHDPWRFAPTGWRNVPTVGVTTLWRDARDGEHHVEARWRSQATAELRYGAAPQPGDDGTVPADDRPGRELVVVAVTADTVVIELDGARHHVGVDGTPETGLTLTAPEGAMTVTRVPRFEPHDPAEAGSGPVAPLPGTVLSVAVSPGEPVEPDTVLMVIEAMKMEHRITAGAAGTVREVRVAAGDRVDTGALLAVIEPH